MWVLRKRESDCCFYLLHQEESYTVGRSGAQLILRGDDSISRCHAKLTISGNSLFLEDVGSKYGTYLNGGIATKICLKKCEKMELQVNDTIRFGMMENIWMVERKNFVSLKSTMCPEEVLEMQQILKQLDGQICLQNWSNDCTHLTMTQVSMTEKLLYALVEQIPIVSIKFWRDTLNACKQNLSKLPDAEDYAPTVNEMAIDIGPNLDRKSVFNGMTFVFLNATALNLYNDVIKRAGGNSKNLYSGVQKSLLIKPNVAVIQHGSLTQSQTSQITINGIADILAKHGKRMIPSYEIGLAIVHCCTQKYCNADYKMVENLFPIAKTEAETGFSAFLENTTKSCTEKAGNSPELVVPETDQSTTESLQVNSENVPMSESTDEPIGVAVKRKRGVNRIAESEDDEIDRGTKKQHIETVNKERGKRVTRSSIEVPEPANEVRTALRATRSNAVSVQKPPPKPVVADDDDDDMGLFDFTENSQVQAVSPKRSTRSNTASAQKPQPKHAEKVDDDDDMVLFEFTENSQVQAVSPKRSTRSAKAKSTWIAEVKDSSKHKTRSKATNAIFNTNPADISDEEAETPAARGESSKPSTPAKQNTAAEMDDDDDELLFDFMETSNFESTLKNKSPKRTTRTSPAKGLTKSPSKRSPKPLPITTVTRTRNTRTTAGFLEKSQVNQQTERQNISSNEQPNDEQSTTSKRRRIAVIDDDDDDDNLFDFSDDESSKKVRLNATNPYHRRLSNDDADGLFRFTDKQTLNENVEDADCVPTQPFVAQENSLTKSRTIQMPKPKILPKQVDISGWLSCGGIKLEPKLENEIKEDIDDEATLAKQQWLDSLKGGFEVEFCALNITTNSSVTKDGNKSNTSIDSGLNSTGQKNFKNFVKKRNLHPQQRIIQLCAQPLPGRC